MIPYLLILVGVVTYGLYLVWLSHVMYPDGDWEHSCEPPKATQRRVGRTWRCSCGATWKYKEDMRFDSNGPSFYREKVER